MIVAFIPHATLNKTTYGKGLQWLVLRGRNNLCKCLLNWHVCIAYRYTCHITQNDIQNTEYQYLQTPTLHFLVRLLWYYPRLSRLLYLCLCPIDTAKECDVQIKLDAAGVHGIFVTVLLVILERPLYNRTFSQQRTPTHQQTFQYWRYLYGSIPS